MVGGAKTRQFYQGKCVLVTGATGFIGKVLIEKLLYSCPEVDKIYLLIRSAQGASASQRLNEMIGELPFNVRLKRDFIEKKLVAVESDLAKPKLGLAPEFSGILIDQISIIFHVAASVKFEAPLEVNMRHNVVATRELFEFACHFKRLQCFVHVSTAYSNCQLRQIDERIYPMAVPEDLISLEVTKQMIDNRPNTYTYTKAMAENVASKYAGLINVVIVRPSIVMSAIKEPTEGWVDTINGPVGLSILGALGILQQIKVNSEVVFDLIPVDIVTNALVAIAWAATEKKFEFLPGSSPSLATVTSSSSSSSTTTITEKNNNLTNNLNLNNNNNNNHHMANTPAAAKAALAVASNGFVKPASRIAKCIEKFSASAASSLSSESSNSGGSIDSSTAADCSITKSTTSNHHHRNLDGTVRVFNLTTGNENPCSFYQYFSTGRDEAYKKPSIKVLRPLLTIPKQQRGMNSIRYWIYKIFSHLLFAHIIDTLMALLGHKKMVVKAVNRMHRANEIFDYFCSNQWNFVTDNVRRLQELQTANDRIEFNCDVREINWDKYARIAWLGCRRFILREPDETIDYAKRRYRLICFVYYALKIILSGAITGLLVYQLNLYLISSFLMLVPVYGIVYLM